MISKCIAKDDLISRWGGDEFLVLLKNQNIHQAKKISKNIRLTLAETKKDKFKNVTVSIGLAELHQKTDLEEAINLVDNLMYQAKKPGKNKIAF